MENHQVHVVILKAPAEENDLEDPYVKVLNCLGISSVMVPTLQFRMKNLDNLAECLKHPENYSGIIINSPRCANSLVKSFKIAHDENLKLKWKNLPCFVVGDASASIIKNNLMFSCEGTDSGNLSQLLDFISKYSLDKVVLMPCGNLHKERETSVKIEKIEVYETYEHPALRVSIESILDTIDVPLFISFFSPSGVKSALPYLKKFSHKSVKFIAIGPTTARELESNGEEVSGICEKPTPENLVKTVLKIMKKI